MKQPKGISTPDKYAIFKAGGKQYQAIEGKTVAVEKIDGEPGTPVEFTAIFRKASPGDFKIGQPELDQPVKASIVKQMRGPKLVVFKFKRRKKVRVKKGHRQPMTIVRIESI